jgi:hypothetical protein
LRDDLVGKENQCRRFLVDRDEDVSPHFGRPPWAGRPGGPPWAGGPGGRPPWAGRPGGPRGRS